MEYYDYVIIGAGPTGLTIAHYMSKINKKCIIIEKEKDIGGCHRVTREYINNEYLFTEHGPRVYSDVFFKF